MKNKLSNLVNISNNCDKEDDDDNGKLLIPYFLNEMMLDFTLTILLVLTRDTPHIFQLI